VNSRSALPTSAAAAYLLYQLAAAAYAVYLRLRLLAGFGAAPTRELFTERLGRWQGKQRPRAAACLWVHAASLGEVLLVAPLLARLRVIHPEAHLLLTCNTASGRAAAEQLNVDEIRYFPVDYAPIIKRLLTAVRPAALILVETEIWPCLLLEAGRASVATAMVNACVSQRSYQRYQMVRGLIGPVLAGLSLVCVRDQSSARRLADLGVEESSLRLLGDLKLDAVGSQELEQTPDLLGPLVAGAPVLLAISTHPGEEEVILAAFTRLRQRHSGLKLVLAPRHPARAAMVLELARGVGAALRWSQLCAAKAAHWDILVVDTTGQLRGFMKAATAGFVGGSLLGLGGHNLLEPAAFGLPVATGPSLENVEDQARELGRCGCLEVVADGEELAAVWAAWLEQPAARAARSRALSHFVAANGGALEATVAALDDLLGEPAG